MASPNGRKKQCINNAGLVFSALKHSCLNLAHLGETFLAEMCLMSSARGRLLLFLWHCHLDADNLLQNQGEVADPFALPCLCNAENYGTIGYFPSNTVLKFGSLS